MKSVLEWVRLYLAYASAAVRAQMQYRAAFAVRSVVDAMVVIIDFAPVYILVRHFGALQGWSFAELALLYGLVGLSWGLVEGALHGFENFAKYLVQGELDRMLLRPRSIVLQLAGFEFQPRKLGRIAQASTVLSIAIWYLELGPEAFAWILLGLGGGVLFFTGIIMLGAASQFWTLGHTSELQNMLTYGGSAALTYPMTVYTGWFRRVLTYGIPLAFVNYFPAIAALGRTEAEGWPTWVPALSPLACLATLVVGHWLFGQGLRRYESTGT